MIRCLWVVTLICIWQSNGWAAGEVRKGVTPSGLSFLFVRANVKETVAISFNFEGGAANDGLNGPSVSSVAAAALFLGADGMTGADITEAFQDFGASFTLQTNVEDISGIVAGPIGEIQSTVNLTNRVLTKPDFPPGLTDQLIETIYKNVHDAQLTPEGKAQIAFAAAIAEPHPYGAAIIGDSHRTRVVTRDDLLNWTREHFVRDRLKVSVVGDLSEADMAGLVDKLFVNLAPKSTLAAVPQPKLRPIAQPIITVDGDSGEQAWVVIGGATLDGVSTESHLTAAMLQMIFSHGSKSRLFAAIREDGGNTYGMDGQLMIFQKITMQFAFGRIAKRNLGLTIEKLRAAWLEYRENGPNELEIQDIKRLFIDWYWEVQNDALALAGFIQANQLMGLTLTQMNDFETMMNGLDLRSSDVRKSLYSETPVIIVVN